ncbi:MAG: hypothetical protein Ct9H300mP15_30080 [Gemmatimonadota bacterium]|nr:MAG: hypothetical protein Ct9H300mP15_30080 [Gemmatimonadota bacterium]
MDGQLNRTFAPHLAQVNFGFSLGSNSSIFRWLSFLSGGDEGETPAPQAEEPDVLDPFEATGTRTNHQSFQRDVARYLLLSQLVVGSRWLECESVLLSPETTWRRCHDESDAYRYDYFAANRELGSELADSI